MSKEAALSAEQLRQKCSSLHADRKDLHWAKRLKLANSELGQDLALSLAERTAARVEQRIAEKERDAAVRELGMAQAERDEALSRLGRLAHYLAARSGWTTRDVEEAIAADVCPLTPLPRPSPPTDPWANTPAHLRPHEEPHWERQLRAGKSIEEV